MTEPYLQHGKVLIRYETLYFQPRKNQRNICDPTSSNPRNSGMHHVKKNSRVISQLRLVGSHNNQFGVGSSRRLGIIRVPFWEVQFFE